MGVLEDEYVGTRWTTQDKSITYRVVKIAGNGKIALCNEETWVIDPYNFNDEQMHVYIIRHSLRRA